MAHHHPIVAFEDVRVRESHRIGEEGDRLAFAHDWFRYERFMVAARCMGAAERLLSGSARFASCPRERRSPQSGRLYASTKFSATANIR